MGSDQVGIVDIGVIEVPACLHLGLDGLNDFALTKDLVIDLDARDFLECLCENFRLVRVRRNAFGQDVDFHAVERFGRLNEPLHLGKLLVFGKNGRLEFLVDPLLCRCFIGISRSCSRKYSTGCNCGE